MRYFNADRARLTRIIPSPPVRDLAFVHEPSTADTTPISLHGNGHALIVVDVQNDFLPGGSLPVAQGDEVVPVLNRYLQAFSGLHLPIFATRDWHPPAHCSFEAQGGLWPRHCVAGSRGAEFAPGPNLPDGIQVISEATSRAKDAYSGFDGTDLLAQLRHANASNLYIGDLATELCVLNTVRDALRYDFRVYLLSDAVRAIDAEPSDGAQALGEMQKLGAITIQLHDIEH